MERRYGNGPKLEKAVQTTCQICNTLLLWNQKGDVPKYCDSCYHKTRGQGMSHAPIWMKTKVPSKGSFLKRIDSLVHWSPQSERWYLREPDRWVGASIVEVERAFSWLYWQNKPTPDCDARQEQAIVWQSAIEEYKALKEQKFKEDDPYSESDEDSSLVSM